MYAIAIINYKHFKSDIKNQECNKNFINFLLNTLKVGLDFISMGNKFQSLQWGFKIKIITTWDLVKIWKNASPLTWSNQLAEMLDPGRNKYLNHQNIWSLNHYRKYYIDKNLLIKWRNERMNKMRWGLGKDKGRARTMVWTRLKTRPRKRMKWGWDGNELRMRWGWDEDEMRMRWGWAWDEMMRWEWGEDEVRMMWGWCEDEVGMRWGWDEDEMRMRWDQDEMRMRWGWAWDEMRWEWGEDEVRMMWGWCEDEVGMRWRWDQDGMRMRLGWDEDEMNQWNNESMNEQKTNEMEKPGFIQSTRYELRKNACRLVSLWSRCPDIPWLSFSQILNNQMIWWSDALFCALWQCFVPLFYSLHRASIVVTM